MKAKSKVLLGLLVALAMVVMAVPAFAASTFTVPSVTPQNEGVAYVGGKAKIDVTINTETPAEAEGPYTVTITDTTTGKTDKVTFADGSVADADIQATNTVTLESGTIGNEHNNGIGEHTFKVVVKDNAKGTIEYQGNVKIEVKAGLTANFSGYEAVTSASTEYALPATAKVGDKFNLNGLVEGGEGPYSFSWQMSSERTGATTAKKDVADWTEFSTEQNPVYVAAQADEDKYVRLVVTDADENVVVATGADAIKADAAAVNKATIALPTTINNTGAITFTQPATATTVTKVVGQNTDAVPAAATGGTGDLTYKWYKDGVEITDADIAEGANLKAITGVTEENAGVYTCVATDESTPAVTATSPAYTLNVKKAPSYELTSSVGTVSTAQKATWGATAAETAGSGTLYLTKEQAANDVKLTLNIENALDKDAAIAWSGAGIETTTAANKTEVTLTGPVAAGERTVKVSYPGYSLTASTGYVLKIVVTDGTLTATNGGIFKAAGTEDPTVSPVYTITLPEGVVFNENISAETLVSWIQNKPTGLAVEVQTGTGENQSNTVSFTLDNSHITATPSVKNMEININQNKLTPNTSPVVLPVSKDIGWEITGTLADNKIKVETTPVTYTGEELPATIVKDDSVTEDIGEITTVYYQQKKGAEAKDVTKATTTTPTDAGEYYVWADVAASKAYPAAEKVAAKNTYTISAIKIDKNNAETYLDWVKEKEYTGDVLDAEVAFKDGFTKTGKVSDKVIYKDAKDNVVQPTNKGVYKVFISTEPDGDDNPCGNFTQLANEEIGTFTITGKEPTPDLYTMKPTEVTYNEAEQGTNVTKADEEAGNVKAVYYYPEGSDEPLEGLPTEAGVYTVKIDTEESDVYAATEEGNPLELGTFTIKKEKTDEQPVIYMNAHVQDQGWDKKNTELNPGEAVDVGTTGLSRRVEAVAIMVPEDYKVVGFAHVQNVGDAAITPVESSKDYNIPDGYKAYEFGSTGKSQRVEAVCIGIQDADGEYVKGFQYAVHLQNYGWQGYVRNGSFSGTRGMALRMESIRFTYADPDVVKPGEPSGSLLR